MDTKSDKQILWKGRFIQLVIENGWEYVERINLTGIVGIVAVTDDREIVFVEQFRRPIGRNVIEIPAGLVGDQPGDRSEDMIAAARRELIEETGYDAEAFDYLIEGPPAVGLTSEVLTFYMARGLKKVGDGGGDGHEDIKVHIVPLTEAESWLKQKEREGVAVDPKVYMGLYFAGK